MNRFSWLGAGALGVERQRTGLKLGSCSEPALELPWWKRGIRVLVHAVLLFFRFTLHCICHHLNQFLYYGSLKPDICCNTVSKFTLNQFWPISEYQLNFLIKLNYKCFESSGVLTSEKGEAHQIVFWCEFGTVRS